MRDAPPLMPIFRSSLQAEVLMHVLIGNPADPAPTAADLSRRLDRPEPSVAREVRRLLDTGIIRGEQRGRLVLLHPDETNPATAPLRELLTVTYGPATHLRHVLAGLSGIEAAYVYGPWAARYAGQPGPTPQEIDLIVVGSPDRQIEQTLREAQATLRRGIAVTYVTPRRWAAADVPFLARIRSGPLTPVVG
ncbi:MAG: hypothetical protein FWH11_14970 [Micrococcales bacterium]|nr:hypothetical protein [Micrococcales bacterium]